MLPTGGPAQPAWEQITSVFPKGAAPAAIETADRSRAGPVLRQIRSGARQGLQESGGRDALGLTGKEWADISNPGLDAIVGIRDAAIAAGAAHLGERLPRRSGR